MNPDYVTVKGYVKDGKLEVELPENVVDGEAEVKVVVSKMETLSTTREANDNLADLPSNDTVAEALPSGPLTGAEIVARGLTGGWKDLGITDSIAWVEEQKRKRRERHQWQSD